MFTVLLCGKTLMSRLQGEYSYVLDMLRRQEDCTVLTWNPEGLTLQQAVPGLRELVAGRSQWRAVVVQDRELLDPACIDRQNPFDAVGTLPLLQDFGEGEIHALLDELADMKDDDCDQPVTAGEMQAEEAIRRSLEQAIADSAAKALAYRREKGLHYRAAVEQPLTRLAIWLAGSPMDHRPQAAAEWPAELLATDAPVDMSYYEHLRDRGLLLADVEQVRAACVKHALLTEAGLTAAALPNPPASVLVIGERLRDRAQDVFRTAWDQHEELEYSNFCDDNLYPERLRFVLYDVAYQLEEPVPAEYLEFITFIYLMAGNELPEGAVRSRRVYSGSTRLDTRRLRRFFSRYLQKLEMTRRLLVNHLRRQEYDEQTREPVLPEEAIAVFESDADVPVEIRSAVDWDSLMAKKDVGFAKDCPRDEYGYWYDQVRQINKRFIRYLREPRRALSHATRHGFRDQSVIEDERILRLNEDQLEDIDYRLLEEEQKMVETATPRLFMTKEYTRRIDKADQEVRHTIEKRMTRKKTLVAGILALAVYLFGFLPLLFGNAETPAGVAGAWTVTGVAMGVLALIGLVFLWVQRKRLRDRILHFNKEMSDILEEIHMGLQAFSRYLGHACNVRREFSVFRYLERDTRRKQNILKKHLHDVEEQIRHVNALFTTAVDPGEFISDDVQPYDFDFTQPASYVYEIPYEDTDSRVEFIQRGHTVTVPIDYVQRVTLTREELYD